MSIWSGRRNHAFGIPEKRETTKRQGHFGDDHLRMIDLNLFRVLNAMMELRSVGVLPTPELARKISYPSCRSVFATRLQKITRFYFAFGCWSRGTSAQRTNAKVGHLFQRVAKPDQERNGINGGDPRSGEEAVYAGFDLEQA